MNIEALRHSASHILADAVKRIYPNAKLGIGPAIANGFYYDFDVDEPFTPENLAEIEKEMSKIVKGNSKFESEEISKDAAVKLFKKMKEPYKLEIIEGIEGDTVSIYKHGEFLDLCKGPHINSTGEVGAFKLTSIAGAYWRGSENNPMMQRIYGTAFATKDELDKYLNMLEEAKKRDHRKLGKELGLFTLSDEVGPGLVLYHPNGGILRSVIEDFIKKEHVKRGYDIVIGPHMMRSDIWKRSGHYDYYKENMFTFESAEQEYVLKPMNCPGHILIYQSKTRSYRDLPMRLFELGTVYRNEKSGVLHGLLRVRGFTQDDAHIFCLKEQAGAEIKDVVRFVIDTMKVFGFDKYKINLSTRPKDSIGSDEDWAEAQKALSGSLDEMELSYEIKEGEGAFYGPKIDIELEDALGRNWQCATVQCDFALPARFELKYIGKDGKEARPIMLHRVILGSLERFIATLIEHYGGSFPLWLSPVQVEIIPISEKFSGYAIEVKKMLDDASIRSHLDDRNQTLSYKIRDAQSNKTPYMAIVGEREAGSGSVSVRARTGDEGSLKVEAFIEKLEKEIREKIKGVSYDSEAITS
ncbi:MAG: threonine--tRNA ligase [Candidatus Omnitrophica bacterium CG1_02_49_10]|nr:MAG: threonine--tRNA ligase [Candidatus Omnitrophica bacterium CG1_02_49_10]